ncbi:MAG: cysteine desulfurase-like protein [Acidobacteriota bacterium]
MDEIRSHFPSLSCIEGVRPPVFFDNPGGTQVVREAVDAVDDYYLRHNANHGGVFATSVRSDAILHEAHAAMCDFLGAASPDEIVFGPNMTSLVFNVSRAIGRTLRAGDEIVVTRLDHDANIAPWLALQDCGIRIRWADIHPEDCSLDMESLERAITDRTRLVALGLASNAVGTVSDVKSAVKLARAAGAIVHVDAVHYAPHGPIDVQDLGCDLLSCSVYKFFGPHVGAMYGRYDLLDDLPAYKVRPAGDRPPHKFETGTQNHEGIAGTLGALRYLEGLGRAVDARAASRRERLRAAMSAIRTHEQGLSRALIEKLSGIDGLRIWGITDLGQLDRRVPTVSFTMDGMSPREIAEYLAREGIYVWDGNYYALAVMERLGLQESGGMVRVGAVHYNKVDEVERLVEALGRMPKRSRSASSFTAG